MASTLTSPLCSLFSMASTPRWCSQRRRRVSTDRSDRSGWNDLLPSDRTPNKGANLCLRWTLGPWVITCFSICWSWSPVNVTLSIRAWENRMLCGSGLFDIGSWERAHRKTRTLRRIAELDLSTVRSTPHIPLLAQLLGALHPSHHISRWNNRNACLLSPRVWRRTEDLGSLLELSW